MDSQEKLTTIDEVSIKHFVDVFYERIREHDVLGPMFIAMLPKDWQPHLNKLYDFWSSILLTTRRYHGNPVRQHMMIQGLSPQHFELWLELFSETLHDIFSPEIAQDIHNKAFRMGKNMQKAIFEVPETWQHLKGNLI